MKRESGHHPKGGSCVTAPFLLSGESRESGLLTFAQDVTPSSHFQVEAVEGSSESKPRARARATAWTRFFTPSFEKMLHT